MYILANVQLQFWNAQLERYKAMTEALQINFLFNADKSYVTRKRRYFILKSEKEEIEKKRKQNAEMAFVVDRHGQADESFISGEEIREPEAKHMLKWKDVLELKEAIKVKDHDYMQAQNQQLLKMLAEMDEYNKIVSEIVKMKQSHNALLSEKQSLDKQLEQLNPQISGH
ncbi:hypothetical protein ACFE04_003164 [Oxalis oulophora]